MIAKEGEVYVCKQPYCGTEIKVIKGADPACFGRFSLRCCCGWQMVLKEAPVEVEHPEAVAA